MAPRTLASRSAGRWAAVALLVLALLALALAAGLGVVLTSARTAERPPPAADAKDHVL